MQNAYPSCVIEYLNNLPGTGCLNCKYNHFHVQVVSYMTNVIYWSVMSSIPSVTVVVIYYNL